MKMLNIALNIAQIQQTQSSDPLINQGGEDMIYLGIGMLAIAITLILGIISRRLEYAIIFSTLLAAVLILISVAT